MNPQPLGVRPVIRRSQEAWHVAASRRGDDVPDAARLALALALFGALALRVWLSATLPLADTTEARYGEIVRVGLEHGYWLMPHAAPDVPFFAKPPLSTWGSMLTGAAFGASAFALRLAPFLATLAVAAIVHGIARDRPDAAAWEPPLAVAVVLTAPLGFVTAGAVMTDAAHLLAVTVAMACGWRLLGAPAGRRAGWRWGFWLAVGIGTLAKGLATVALIGVPLLLHGLASRAPWRTWRPFLAPGPIVAAIAACLPWFVAAEAAYPGFLDYFVVGEHLSRFLEPGWQGDRYGTAHRAPIGMIWLFALAGLGPWVPAALVVAWRSRRAAGATAVGAPGAARAAGAAGAIGEAAAAGAGGAGGAGRPSMVSSGQPGAAWWVCWMLAPLLMFSLARNVIWTYALTAVPPFAVWFAARAGRLTPTGARRLAFATVGWVALLAACAPYVAEQVEATSARRLLAVAEREDPVQLLPLTVPSGLKFSGAFYSRGRACIAADAATESACAARGPGLRIVPVARVEAERAAGTADVVATQARFALLRDRPPQVAR